MNVSLQVGKQSIAFDKPVYIMSSACIVGPKEGEGPMKDTFDVIVEDPAFGEDSWEEGESQLMKETSLLALRKA
ncbi:MAG: stage V sporulation protein AD, partial [Clostridiales bacterium]|nr:stage V sporulation protein AD [Clostridiales bacterium]